MTIKHSVLEVQEAFRRRGLTPLFLEYLNNTQELPFQCSCGRQDVIKWCHFITAKDVRCWYCAHNIKGKEEEKIEKLRYLLQRKNLTPVEPLLFPAGDSCFFAICSCGEKVSLRVRYLWEVKEDFGYKCKKCQSKAISTPLNKIRDEITRKGAIPDCQDSSYQNQDSLIKFFCSCGGEGYVTIRKLRRVKKLLCEKCKIQKYTIPVEEAQKVFLDKGFSPLFKECRTKQDKLPYKCNHCGRTLHATLSDMSKKHRYTTGKCIKCQSKERRISFEEVLYEFEQVRGLKVLSKESEYYGKLTKLRIQCKCGKETIKSYANTVISKTSGLCRECIRKHSYQRGIKHFKYNPSLTVEDRTQKNVYSSTWANQIRKFFNNCLISGDTKEILRAHHLNGRHWDKINKFNFLNGVCLSDSCHKEFHKKYGYGNNTKDQFMEWVEEKNISFNPEKRMRDSSFFVRRLLLYFDFKNIGKVLGIQVKNTKTPHLLELTYENKSLFVFISSIKGATRELLRTIKEETPKCLILFPEDILTPEKREVLYSFLKKRLGFEYSEINLNSCVNTKITQEEANVFLKENAIERIHEFNLCYALKKENEIIACMSFNKKQNHWRLVQFCENKNYTIKGAFEKLYESFLTEKDPKKCYYIKDSRYDILPPEVFKEVRKIRPRKMFAKNSLVSFETLPEDAKKTPLKEYLKVNKLVKYFDAGGVKYIWRKNI